MGITHCVLNTLFFSPRRVDGMVFYKPITYPTSSLSEISPKVGGSGYTLRQPPPGVRGSTSSLRHLLPGDIISVSTLRQPPRGARGSMSSLIQPPSGARGPISTLRQPGPIGSASTTMKQTPSGARRSASIPKQPPPGARESASTVRQPQTSSRRLDQYDSRMKMRILVIPKIYVDMAFSGQSDFISVPLKSIRYLKHK